MMAIAVADVCGSSDRVAVSHSDDTIEWQRRLAVALRGAAEPREPAVLKLTGDGCFAVFEDPVVALAFLRDLQAVFSEMGLEVHSGVEIGRVELYDGDAVGPAAFVASELCKRATAGQIVGSRNVVDLAGRVVRHVTDPDGLDHHQVERRSERLDRLAGGHGQSAEASAGGGRADEHAVVARVVLDAGPVAEQSAA